MRALITGATSGIGEATAKLFASKNISLILTGRNQEKLDALKAELSKLVSVEIYSVDLQNRVDRQKIVYLLQQQPVDILINNAGFGLYGPILAKSSTELLDIVELDVAAVVELTHEAAKALVAANMRGTILNVSSAAAFQPIPNLAVYAAAKAFINSFSQAADFELETKGIRVLTNCPGKVATSFSKRASGGKTLSEPAGGNVMTPEFVAEQIWNQITHGQTLRVVNWRYRIATLFSSWLPTSWSTALSTRFMKKAEK